MRHLRTIALPVFACLALFVPPCETHAATRHPLAQEIIELPGPDIPLDRSSLRTVYSVGGARADDWSAFGDIKRRRGSSVAGLAFGPEGGLRIVDSQIHRIFTVDTEGRLVHEFGRTGEGPGEMGISIGIVVDQSRRTVHFDGLRLAYQVFDENGDFLWQGRFPGDGSTTGTGIIRAQRTRQLGELIVLHDLDDQGLSFRRLKFAAGEFSEEAFGRPWLPDGRSEDGNSDGRLDVVSLDPVELAWTEPPMRFYPRVYFAPLPDNAIAVVDSSAYRVKLYGIDGELKRVIHRPIPVDPVTESLKRSAREHMASEPLEGLPQGPTEGMLFFDEVPVIRDMAVSWEGTLWIRRRGEEPVNDHGPVDLVRADGEYLGTFLPDDSEQAGHGLIPDAFGPDGLVAFIEEGELGALSVVVKRLPPEIR